MSEKEKLKKVNNIYNFLLIDLDLKISVLIKEKLKLFLMLNYDLLTKLGTVCQILIILTEIKYEL